jgi:hypothetical protein
MEMKAFDNWLKTVDKDFCVKNITVQSIFMRGSSVGFIEFESEGTDSQGNALPGKVFMLGGASVGVLLINFCSKGRITENFVLTVKQCPVGEFNVPKLPVGTLDDSGNFDGAAAKCIKDKMGIKSTPSTWST